MTVNNGKMLLILQLVTVLKLCKNVFYIQSFKQKLILVLWVFKNMYKIKYKKYSL